jgi:hypothetical protein
MKNVIILFILTLVINKALCQSVTIQPNDFNSSLNTSKIGINTIKIEGKTFTDHLNFFYTNGSANIKLIGNPNFQDFSAQSNNTIDFLHGNISRWSIGDFFSEDFSNENNSFRIRDLNNPQSQTPFEIVKGSNKVMLNSLKIGSLFSEVNDGRVLKISTEGNVVASSNEFVNISPLDLTTIGTGSFTKEFAGSFGPNATSQILYAPLHLPQGSKLQSLTVTYKDNSLNSSLSVAVVSRSVNNITTSITSVNSTNVNSSLNLTMTPSVYFDTIINNVTHLYYLEIRPRNHTNSGSGNWDNALVKFVKAVVEYR